jgi:hypothetical protein
MLFIFNTLYGLYNGFSIALADLILRELARQLTRPRPILGRGIQLEPQLVRAIAACFAVRNAAARSEASSDRLQAEIVVRIPEALGQHARAVATHINR